MSTHTPAPLLSRRNPRIDVAALRYRLLQMLIEPVNPVALHVLRPHRVAGKSPPTGQATNFTGTPLSRNAW